MQMFCSLSAVYCAAGWQCSGSFIKGRSKACGEWDLGEMWECPFFVCLPHTSGGEQRNGELWLLSQDPSIVQGD
jgi:hypothetical protein